MAQNEAREIDRKAEDVLRLLEQRTSAAQSELASRTDAGEDVLTFLAHNGAPATRRAVAANIAAPAQVNRHLADDEEEDVRAELARKIARLMPGLTKREAKHIQDLTIETLERLAADQVPRVRAILAEEIKHMDAVPKHVVQLLARDVEEVVHVPILEYSPLLSDADLVEIIAEGKVHSVLAAIARRKPVSASVSDAVVSSLDIPAVAALLANPDAAIRERTLDAIIDQAERISVWQEAVCVRADLSKRAIRRLASFVSTAMIELLSARHTLDEETKVHLNRQLRARYDADEQIVARDNTAAAEVEAAAKAGRLDDAFVESAAEMGKREAVLLALSRLAKIPDSIVRRMLMTRSAKPVTALVWRAGLSMRCAFKIQRFLMKLPADELLPARNGTLFPISEEEMRWHLSYFGAPE
ncbi:MAG TPA: DUF2336 domain-containing protein [Rhizomicrobium sp.]|jgi:uncharacterized protein (DUF2336 family)|nr:DUF2336 domain-containing protein [Rhizomicrobium sp.]